MYWHRRPGYRLWHTQLGAYKADRMLLDTYLKYVPDVVQSYMLEYLLELYIRRVSYIGTYLQHKHTLTQTH